MHPRNAIPWGCWPNVRCLQPGLAATATGDGGRSQRFVHRAVRHRPAQLGCRCYGSPVEAPDLDALAKGSVLSNNVHTTPLFADPVRHPTARNQHSNAMSCIAEGPPAYFCGNGNIPFENSFLSETLLQHDYNTIPMQRQIAPSTCRPDIGITIS
jgi:hypothetical protein